MKRLLDALSWLSETWKISIAVKDETTVDVYVDMYIPQRVDARACDLWRISHILREASALSVLLQWAIPGPQKAERATSTALTLYIFYSFMFTEESPGIHCLITGFYEKNANPPDDIAVVIYSHDIGMWC